MLDAESFCACEIDLIRADRSKDVQFLTSPGHRHVQRFSPPSPLSAPNAIESLPAWSGPNVIEKSITSRSSP